MTMKKRMFIVSAMLIASGVCLKTGMGVAQHKKEDNRPGISFGIMAAAEKTATSCGQVTMKIFDLKIVRGEVVRRLAKSMAPMLWAKSAGNGGINVQSWDRDYYEVKACTGAGAETTADAQRLLS